MKIQAMIKSSNVFLYLGRYQGDVPFVVVLLSNSFEGIPKIPANFKKLNILTTLNRLTG